MEVVFRLFFVICSLVMAVFSGLISSRLIRERARHIVPSAVTWMLAIGFGLFSAVMFGTAYAMHLLLLGYIMYWPPLHQLKVYELPLFYGEVLLLLGLFTAWPLIFLGGYYTKVRIPSRRKFVTSDAQALE